MKDHPSSPASKDQHYPLLAAAQQLKALDLRSLVFLLIPEATNYDCRDQAHGHCWGRQTKRAALAQRASGVTGGWGSVGSCQ